MTRFARVLWAAAAVAALAAAASGAKAADGVRALMSSPASVFTVGMLNLDRLMDSVEGRLWRFTYDLSNYGDDDDSYALRRDAINYRYGGVTLDEDIDSLLLTGTVIAHGRFLDRSYCSAVIGEMREALLDAAGIERSAENRAAAFVGRLFPTSVAAARGSDVDVSTTVLDEILLEVQMYTELPDTRPAARCTGYLHRDLVVYADAG